MATSITRHGISPLSIILLVIILLLFSNLLSFKLPLEGAKDIYSIQSLALRDNPVFSTWNQSQEVSNLEARIDHLKNTLLQLQRIAQNTTTPSAAAKTSYDISHQPLLLPTCESLMQQLDSPVADGAFLSRTSTPNTWTLRADGSRELTLPLTCRLKRYTSSEARQCLKERHLSFIGDSLTRFQFLSLAYFIEREEYPSRFGKSNKCTHIDEKGKPTCSQHPNVCTVADWHGRDWISFHSAMLKIFHRRFECLCARENGAAMGTENFLYTSKEEIKMSFISELGWGGDPLPVHGWNFTDCSRNASCSFTAEDSEGLFYRANNSDWDWNEPLYKALNGTLQKVLPKVNVVIYNRGLWGALEKRRANVIMPLLKSWSGVEGRCFYRTTTASSRSPEILPAERSYVKDATFHAGCGYLDFAHLTQEFESFKYAHPPPPMEENYTIWNFRERNDIYWDAVHFMPWVYEELNNLLLNVLCNHKRYE